MSLQQLVKAYTSNPKSDDVDDSTRAQLATEGGNVDFDDADVIAFTQNAAGFGSGSKNKIKTQVVKKKQKVSNPEDAMMNEDQAIAAFSMKDLSEEDLAQKEEKSAPKKTHVAKAQPKVQKKIEKPKPYVPYSDPSLPEANVDMSSIENIPKDEHDAELQQVEEALSLPANTLTPDTSNEQQTNAPQTDEKTAQSKSTETQAPSDDSKPQQTVSESQKVSQAPVEDQTSVQTSEETNSTSTPDSDQTKPEVKQGESGGDKTIQEVVNDAANLKNQLKDAIEDKQKKEKQLEEKKQLESVNESDWGQMDTMMVFSKEQVTKAQGYEDPEPVEPKPAPPPPPVLSKEEQEKRKQEKILHFSEFVAAAAEASQPVIKKEDPMKKPLHFKYYDNDGEENEVTDQLTDSILGKQSAQINKKQVKLKYDHSDADWNVTPIEQVDYSKSQLNVSQLMEPLQNVDVQDIQTNDQTQQPKQEPSTELTIT